GGGGQGAGRGGEDQPFARGLIQARVGGGVVAVPPFPALAHQVRIGRPGAAPRYCEAAQREDLLLRREVTGRNGEEAPDDSGQSGSVVGAGQRQQGGERDCGLRLGQGTV